MGGPGLPRIVLSSTWRFVPEQIEILRDALLAYGTPLDAVASFADMTRTNWPAQSSHLGRLEEIAEWLDEHPNVRSFLVLDDDADLPIVGKHRSPESVEALRQRF